jgi:hypothetical protein
MQDSQAVLWIWLWQGDRGAHYLEHEALACLERTVALAALASGAVAVSDNIGCRSRCCHQDDGNQPYENAIQINTSGKLISFQLP